MPAPKKPSAVRIRCYRQGFGDCFLLTFATGGARPCRVLIDCGLWPTGPAHTATMRAIAEDIARECGATAAQRGEIDVLVATHEHWDHLSGFNQARDIFEKKLEVRHVWLAWTENPKDSLAKSLREEHAKAKKAATHLHARLSALSGAAGFSKSSRAALGQLESLLGFFGAAGTGASTVQEAMAFVSKGWPGPQRHFHNPGAELALPGVDGVRVYVLGPPRDPKALRREDSKQHGALYELFFGAAPEDSLLAALGALDDDVSRYRDPEEIGKPFDCSHRCPVNFAAKNPAATLPPEQRDFFRRRYTDAAWRRIDTDWLNVGGALALRLDKGINNTSLVLAFELPDGRVLLFPGDAQLGNWQSWHDPKISWKSREQNGERITARHLLGRTAFYKVGHHGSHNATAQDLGLELMNDERLMAFVPISHEMALANKWNRIPLPSLVKRLREQAKGRVWFSVEYKKNGKTFTNPVIAKLAELSATERAALSAAVKPKPLWIDFHL